MALFKNFDGDELTISCNCGCDDGIHFKITDFGIDTFAFATFTNGNFYKDHVLKNKLKKIWAIIRNKDFYYSEIVFSKNDFKQFKDWINKQYEWNVVSEED